MAIKIYNIGAKWFLPEKLDRISPQKIIPQMIFLFCGVFAQFLGTGKGLFLLFHIRTIPLIRPSVRTGAPSPQGKALVTQYNFAGWYHLKKPSLGGKVAAKRTDEGYVPQAIRSVPT